MTAFFLGVGIAVVLLIVWLRVRRRWIEPWGELEELVTAITERKAPRKFLMTANPRANTLALSLEKLTADLQKSEGAVALRADSLESVIGALPDGFVLLDQQRRVQLMNPQFREFYRIDDTRTGAGLLEIVRDAVVDRTAAAALESGELRSASITLQRTLEPRRELEVTAVPLASGDDGARNVIVLFHDVTEMRRVEEMRRDFVANVSHELRTPLSIFRGYLETLLDDPDQPHDELVRVLEVMDRHAERLTLLVEDILTLARLETPGARLDLGEIYLPDFLGGILRDWEKRFGTKLLRAALEAPDDLPIICADEQRLQEVIGNLLDNALKYSQPEGRVTLAAKREGDTVRLSVSDEGVGIPARDLPRIFERFYRADKARSRQLGGTGLGLSIVKHIAQLHGGEVEATSAPDRGTTISVILPLRPPQAVEESSEVAQPQFRF